ncbi:MAG: hypothetical protein IIC39_10730 [Candidatus Marinimicrobia bacterium]|nr:hypothetical protein [Candidatus Neomarinimicrobiota bacterium]
MKKLKAKEINKLYDAIVSIEERKECEEFLRDLLTETELNEVATRWLVARLLNKGATYIEIESITGLSSTTVARVHKWLKKSKGGYVAMLDKIENSS